MFQNDERFCIRASQRRKRHGANFDRAAYVIDLLDADLRLLDSATLGGIYATGSFSPLESAELDTFRFRFIGDTDWSVQVLPEPGFRIPLWSEPTGVSRPVGFTRHFIVRGQPQPEHT